MNIIKKRFAEKDGIAFIITMGLLSLLMITGVSFAVFMKTERAATANLMILNESKDLAKAGVAFAMNEISHSLIDDWYPSEDYGWYIDIPATNPPTAHGQQPVILTGSVDSQSDYYTFEDEVYYQNPILQRLIAPKTFEKAMKFCQMDAISISEDAFGGNIDTNQYYQGNFSYIIVNLSGTLDPNFAGGNMTRTLSGSPDQFSLQNISGIVSTNNFLENRDDMEWYETMGEIEDIEDETADTIDFDNLKAFYPFSMFLNNSTNDSFTGADKIAPVYTTAGDYEQNSRAYDDDGRWEKLGVALIEGAGIAENPLDTSKNNYSRGPNYTHPALINLIDYLDDDNKPGGIGRYEDINDSTETRASYKSPYVDAFPMINEFNLESNFRGRPQNGEYRTKLTLVFNFEVWYPFVSPTYEQSFPGDSAELEYSLRFSNLQSDKLDLLPDEFNGVDTYTGTIPISNNVAVITGSFWDLETDFTANESVPPTNMTAGLSDYDVRIDLDIKIKSGGYTYDGFEDDYMFSFEIPLELDPTVNSGTIINEFNGQVSDPRLNYKEDYWLRGQTKTIGTTNANTIADMTSNSNDDDADMYIKGYAGHSGTLESVGEFGYISIGHNWETVRLLDKTGASRHKIYENLYIVGSETNHGCVNLNSEFEEVLTAALDNMPIVPDKNDDDRLWTKITAAQRDALVDEIISIRDSGSYTGGISPTNLFDSTFSDAIISELGAQTELEKEAFYVAGMPAFNSRQQLFAIISRGNLSNTSRTCLAIVWRDPVPNESGYHTCIIRELIWVNGE